MAKSNTALCAYVENALKERWYYGWGAYGQKATAALVDSLIKQYPAMNARWKDYMMTAASKGNRLCDCYGLVKGFLWTTGNGLEYKSGGYPDMNTGQAYKAAAEKGPLSTMPDIPGIILYKEGHVGVYLGNGRFAECAGGGQGMIEGRMSNGKITKGSDFTNWFKDVNINYATAQAKPVQTAPIVIKPSEPQRPQIQIVELPIIIGDTSTEIHSILYDDLNYVNLREILTVLGYFVENDPFENVPVVSKDDYLAG